MAKSNPKAKKTKHNYSVHNVQLSDDYAWMRDQNWPNVINQEIIEHLTQENEYTENVFAPWLKTVEFLDEKMREFINEDDYTVPYLDQGYYYYKRIEAGQQYWMHCRKYQSLDAKEEIFLDENQLALNQQYCRIGCVRVSANQQLVAYSIDYKGDERYAIYLKDLCNNQAPQLRIENTMGEVVWRQDGSGFFYIPANEQWRAQRVLYHDITLNNCLDGNNLMDSDLVARSFADNHSTDQLIYDEQDDAFSVSIWLSETREYIFIKSSSSDSHEIFWINAKDPTMKLCKTISRAVNYRYDISHKDEYFYILLNDQGNNFRLARVKINSLLANNWQTENFEELIPHNKQRYLVNMTMFQDHCVVTAKENGLVQLLVYKVKEHKEKGENQKNEFNLQHTIQFDDPAYYAEVVFTSYNAIRLRYYYSSLRTPPQIRELDFGSLETNIVKKQKVPKTFDSSRYTVERLVVTARDGTEVMVSVLYNHQIHSRADRHNKKEITCQKTDAINQKPLLLYGYGSYGISIPASFRPNIIPLVDLGFTYAIAHIRGGDDLGEEWYENGKMLDKKNTFFDFIDVAEKLLELEYGTVGRIAIHGGSAGGMLVGACLNLRPDLFNAVLADVPFVDVMNTMLDSSLPLTPGEYQEWGNPEAFKEHFDYIMSYSPYDNVISQKYPHIFATTGLTDPRVGYWEAAKWVAKIREKNTNQDSVILLKTNMNAGHGGNSGRYALVREVAEQYAFLIHTIGNLQLGVE